MKKKFRPDRQEIGFVAFLLVLSMVLYSLHYVIFHDLHHIELYALEDLAFVPIEVLLVSLILHRVLEANERRKKLSKLYMVIETFFYMVGSDLLRVFATNDQNLDRIQSNLNAKENWDEQDIKRLLNVKKEYRPKISFEVENMKKIDQMLQDNRMHMVRMLENPALLEHETFTELLMAVFHLGEELKLREDLSALPKADQNHIVEDAKRAYILLGIEWVDYISHMRSHYPYLYSLAIRVNPFVEKCDVMIKDEN